MNRKVSKIDESLNSEANSTEKNANEIEENVDMRTDEESEIDHTENLLKISKMSENIAAACFEENESVNCEINSDYNIELKVSKTDEDIEVRTDEDIEEIIKKTSNKDVQENIFAYIAGFLAKAYLSKNSCEECQAILVNKNKYLELHTFLLYFKEYRESEVGGLTWPSDDFFSFMKKLSKMYFECVDRYFQKSNVRKNICSYLQSITSEFFKDHVHRVAAIEFIILKFVTMMIKHKIKYYNSKFSSCNTSKKLKHVHHV